VPIEETVGAIADLMKALYVRHIGISEVGAEGLVEVSGVLHFGSCDRLFGP
jgi:aryl-alcohol dehydrogenase-like predicted oxidoreductase